MTCSATNQILLENTLKVWSQSCWEKWETASLLNFLDLYLLLQTFGHLYYNFASHVFRTFP